MKIFLTRNASHTLYGKRPILQQYSSLKNLKGETCEKKWAMFAEFNGHDF